MSFDLSWAFYRHLFTITTRCWKFFRTCKYFITLLGNPKFENLVITMQEVSNHKIAFYLQKPFLFFGARFEN